jgi:hypothetical protein
MKELLERLRKRLYDVTSGSKTVYHARLSKTMDVDASAIDSHLGLKESLFYQFILSTTSTLDIIPVHQPRSEEGQLLSNRFLSLDKKLRQVLEEKGVYELFIGALYVCGKWKTGHSVRAPLLLQPVKLIQERGKWVVEKSGQLQWNESFLYAAEYFQSIYIETLLTDTWLDDVLPGESIQFLTDLYNKLVQLGLEVRCDDNYFSDALSQFNSYTAADFEQEYKVGELWLEKQVVLGIFPQSGSILNKDYLSWLEENIEYNTEKFFLDRYSSNESAVNSEKYLFPFRIDAHQELVLNRINKGESLLIQGPPGSGKSETIANIVAHYMAKGKKVVVVSQKRAALEVVHQRLSSIGLGEHYALVQDFILDRKKIYERIATHIEKLDQYKLDDSTMESIEDEKRFNQLSHQLHQWDKEVTFFHHALYDTSISGYSAHELYLLVNKEKVSPTYNRIYLDYPKPILEKAWTLYKQIEPYHSIEFSFKEFWKERLTDSKAYNDIVSLSDFVDKWQHCWRRREDIENIYKISFKRLLIEIAEVQFSPIYTEYFKQSDITWKDWLKETEAINQWESDSEYFYPMMSFFDLEEAKCLLKYIQQLLDSSSIFFFFQSIFNKQHSLLKRFAKVFGVETGYSELKELQDTLTRFIAFVELKIKWEAMLKHSIPNASVFYQQWLGLKELFEFCEDWIEGQSMLTLKSWFIFIVDFEQVCKEIKSTLDENLFLSPTQLKISDRNPGLLTSWLEHVKKHAIDILSLHQITTAAEVKSLHWCQYVQNNITTEKGVDWAVNSIQYYWLMHIEQIYPVLTTVDSISWKIRNQQWPELYEEKRYLIKKEVNRSVRSLKYLGNEYNRLQNRTTYRDLYHQVTKRRSVWSLRKLMNQFQDELFKLLPCWLMTPEMVSIVFPFKKDIDLVIFDEASQCYTEVALPVIYRAKQIVVTGDTKQMPPYDLYSSKVEKEEEDENSEESVMEFVAKYIPSSMLKGHYRSKHISLIEFSNRNFYNHQLEYIPDKAYVNEKAIEYIHLPQGVWESQVNKAEAEWIVAKVVQLIQQKKLSIGIIAFNYPQANYIQDVLYKTCLEQQVLLPNSVFVKNLENVQGDERDIIFFSITYAPSPSGRFVMQFGSLSKQGGERRLNVAVTRAREKMYVVSSILPNQLQTEGLKNEGVYYLKEYLSYAWEVNQLSSIQFTHLLKRDIPVLSSANKYASTYSQAQGLYPYIDLIIHQEGEEVWVDTDDESFRMTPPKNRFLYKPIHLNQKGWKYLTVWSKSLF